MRERSSSVRPSSSSARPLRVTRKTTPRASDRAHVIQILVQTAPPRVLGAAARPVSALIEGTLLTAAKSSSAFWVSKMSL